MAYLLHIERNGSSAPRAETLVVVVHEETLVARLRRRAATEVPLRMRISS